MIRAKTSSNQIDKKTALLKPVLEKITGLAAKVL